MRLTQKFLNKISYWEVNARPPWYGTCPKTVVTIHFNDWWRFRKKFYFDWMPLYDANNRLKFYEPDSAVELVDQLRKLH